MEKFPLIKIIQTSRPIFWVLLPLAYLTGLSYSENGLSQPGFSFTPVMILQIFFLSFPFCLFTFGLNDIYDLVSDGLNARKQKMKGLSPLAEGVVFHGVTPGVIHFGSLLIAIGMTGVALVSLNPLNLFYTVTLITLSFTYSAPPWRLKGRAPLDAIAGGIIACLCPAAMSYTLVSPHGFPPVQLYLLTFAAMGFHAFSTIMDEEPDSIAGDQTFAVRFGKRPAAILSAATIFFLGASIHKKIFFLFSLFCGILILGVALFPSYQMARRVYLIIFGLGMVLSLVWLIPFFL